MKIVLYKNTECILPLRLIPGVLFEKNRRLYRIVVRVDFDRLGATIKSSFLVRISAGCPGPLGHQQVVQALNLSTVPVVLSNAGIATSASSAFSRSLRASARCVCRRVLGGLHFGSAPVPHPDHTTNWPPISPFCRLLPLFSNFLDFLSLFQNLINFNFIQQVRRM